MRARWYCTVTHTEFQRMVCHRHPHEIVTCRKHVENVYVGFIQVTTHSFNVLYMNVSKAGQNQRQTNRLRIYDSTLSVVNRLQKWRHLFLLKKLGFLTRAVKIRQEWITKMWS
jgi:hypothetical protein